jgi:hypothetical protein
MTFGVDTAAMVAVSRGYGAIPQPEPVPARKSGMKR